MASGWIPMRHFLSSTLEVRTMASLLNERPITIVGALHELWSIADLEGEVSDRGKNITIMRAPANLIADVTGLPEMQRALIYVGWLLVTQTDHQDIMMSQCEPTTSQIDTDDKVKSFTFVNISKWIEKTAKTRLRLARNQHNLRQRKKKEPRSSMTKERHVGCETDHPPTPTPTPIGVGKPTRARASSDEESAKFSSSRIDWGQQLFRWNDIARKNGLTQARRLTDWRKRALKSAQDERGGSLAFWDAVEQAVASLGDFARKKGFVTIDFIATPEKLEKLLDGAYAARSQKESRRVSDFGSSGNQGR